jgi:hypothetical protein
MLLALLVNIRHVWNGLAYLSETSVKASLHYGEIRVKLVGFKEQKNH